MPFGILQRYVMGEVLRAFLLALLTITTIFVLFVIMAEASKKGLTPGDIIRLVPYTMPVSLPYTVPVALLFAVTVVYGRLAGDNEIVAVKACGLSALTVLKPSLFLGMVLGALLLFASYEVIPRSNSYAQKIVLGNLEEMFYKVLKKEREFNNPAWPFFIRVRDVDDKVLLGAIFKHRSGGPDKPNSFDAQVMADRATIAFDLDAQPPVAHVSLWGSRSQSSGPNPQELHVNGKHIDIPIPGAGRFNDLPPKIQEMTYSEMVAQQAKYLTLIRDERRRQAVGAAFWIASGRVGRVDWPHIRDASNDYQRWQRKYSELETEKHLRFALACGCLFFVLLGAPVGILFARRDFLSAFISCFVPIIVVYYPLTLAGVNLGKDGILSPLLAVWAGNLVLGLAAGFIALPPVLKH